MLLPSATHLMLLLANSALAHLSTYQHVSAVSKITATINDMLCCTMQNRTSASAPLPNNQQVHNAYGSYQMLTAAPGQIITLTWPRTAEPDGMVADGSDTLNVYYNPNATINAGEPRFSIVHNCQQCLHTALLHSKCCIWNHGVRNSSKSACRPHSLTWHVLT